MTAQAAASLAATEWDVCDYFSLGGSGRVVSDKGLSIADALAARNVSLRLSPADDVAQALAAMDSATLAVACAGGTTTEGRDRPSLRLDQHDFLTQLGAAPRTVPLVAIVMAPGAVVAPWAGAFDGAAALFLASALFFCEMPTLADLVGGLAILGGLAAVTFGRVLRERKATVEQVGLLAVSPAEESCDGRAR